MANLVEIEDYKFYRDIKGVGSDDKLEVLVPSISALVKSYCKNTFVDFNTANGPKIETLSPRSTSSIFLRELPIISVTTVEEKSSIDAASYTTLVEGTDYYVDTEISTIIRIASGAERNWTTGFNTVRVTYTAGYDTLPEDLKIAIFDLIAYYLKEEYKEDRTIVNSSIKNQGSSSIRQDINFPDHIRRVLNLYRAL